jgi:hypothetical protein
MAHGLPWVISTPEFEGATRFGENRLLTFEPSRAYFQRLQGETANLAKPNVNPGLSSPGHFGPQDRPFQKLLFQAKRS